MRYLVETEIRGDEIHHVVAHEFEQVRTELTRQIIATGDAQVRQALIALGWTPPRSDDNGR